MIGILASVDSEVWRCQLSQLGLNDLQQNNVMEDCMMDEHRGYALSSACKALGKEDRMRAIRRVAMGSKSR